MMTDEEMFNRGVKLRCDVSIGTAIIKETEDGESQVAGYIAMYNPEMLVPLVGWVSIEMAEGMMKGFESMMNDMKSGNAWSSETVEVITHAPGNDDDATVQ
jgi:predicted RNA methylase